VIFEQILECFLVENSFSAISTGLYALRRLSAARATKNRSRACARRYNALCVAFCSATFFYARKNAARFSLSGAKKRRLPPER
jgi:hypothetical protein